MQNRLPAGKIWRSSQPDNTETVEGMAAPVRRMTDRAERHHSTERKI